MNASNYLEAFLAVYGWELYYLMYLIIMMSGLFLYPLFRSVMEILIDDLAGESRENGSLKRIIITAGLMLFVFLMALVPMVEISFSTMQVTTACSTEKVDEANNKKNGSGQYMVNTKTRIPILPYLAMAMGQGVNGAINSNLPCALDITEASKAMMALDFGDNPEGNRLRSEYARFHKECMVEINRMTDAILEGHYDNGKELGSKDSLSGWMANEIDEAIKSKDGEDYGWELTNLWVKGHRYNYKYSPASVFVEKMYFDVESSPLAAKAAEGGFTDKLLEAFKANNPVEGYAGPSGEESEPPTCSDWWRGNGSKEGLKQEIVTNLEKQYVFNVAKQGGISGCNIKLNIGITNEEECLQIAKNKLADGDDKKFTRLVLENSMNKFDRDSALSESQSNAITNAVFWMLVGKVIPIIPDLGIEEKVLATSINFYTMFYILQIMLQFILPFILMTIYMFWGVFMVVGALQGRVAMKGMVAIFMLTIVPGLWRIIDHLDDKLYEALYDSADIGMIYGLQSRIILDMATMIFYLGVLYTAFYVVQLAGEGDASGAVRAGGGEHAHRLSDGLSKPAGSSAIGAYKGTMAWGGKQWDKLKGGIKSWWKKR